MPFLLHGLEFNWDQLEFPGLIDSVHTDRVMASLADRIYEVQESRYETQRVFTARTDHPTSQAPFFVIDAIYAGGYPWNTISESGEHYPELATVSTRAAFAMWALWSTAYTDRLIELIAPLHDPKRGWFEGRYEQTGAYDRTLSASTNAVVLQSLYHKAYGKSFSERRPYRHWAFRLENEFERPNRCFPPVEEVCE